VVSLVLISVAGLVSILFGVRYLLTRQFMPYHAVVSGKSWGELDRGLQIAILGMLKVCGAGFLGYGAALLWLLLPLNRGETWAAWAILTVTAAIILPVLYVTLWLRRAEPKAKTPVVPTIVVLVLVLAGAGSSLVRG
jgi:hypothetical protein